MKIVFAAPFFILFLVIVGISFILKTVFKIRFPLFRTALGLFILLIIYKFIALKFPSIDVKNVIFFEERKFPSSNYFNSYYIFFGKTELDLQNITFYQDIEKINILNFGGNLTFVYTDFYPTKLFVKNIFARTEMPNSDFSIIGSCVLKTSTLDERRKHLTVKIKTIFGSTKIRIIK